MGDWQTICGDALTEMRAMPPSSVDAIIADPPYFRVKNLAWDRAWDDADAFTAWIGELADEWSRILAPNGSLYVFASSKMAARVEVEIGKRFRVLGSIVWEKEGHWGHGSSKEAMRAFFPTTERIVFAEQPGSDTFAAGAYAAACDKARAFVFEPLRSYLDGERERAGVSRGDVHQAWCAARGTRGHMTSHWFGVSQWALPTEKNYLWLRSLFGEGFLLRPHEDLRREYEDLRRPFSVAKEDQWGDVWRFPVVRGANKHPCEKPAQMMEHIIRTSTRPGALVLDCFMGSGSTGEAALGLGRRFVGIDADPAWHARASERLAAADVRRRVADRVSLDTTEAP